MPVHSACVPAHVVCSRMLAHAACSSMPAHAGACRRMPAHAGACRRTPAHAGARRRTPAHAGARRRMPAHAGACRVLSHVGACPYLSCTSMSKQNRFSMESVALRVHAVSTIVSVTICSNANTSLAPGRYQNVPPPDTLRYPNCVRYSILALRV